MTSSSKFKILQNFIHDSDFNLLVGHFSPSTTADAYVQPLKGSVQRGGCAGRERPREGRDCCERLFSRQGKLYRYWILPNYWLFGKPIRNELPLAVENPEVLLTNRDDVYPEMRELPAPWQEKEWPADARQGRLGKF
ncbi:MAG: hypothetical protein AB1426_09800 [Bacillota bacterium]